MTDAGISVISSNSGQLLRRRRASPRRLNSTTTASKIMATMAYFDYSDNILARDMRHKTSAAAI